MMSGRIKKLCGLKIKRLCTILVIPGVGNAQKSVKKIDIN
jgi:hypothetical protein